MTILVFPSALEAAARFAREAGQWGRRVVGASSLDVDPNRAEFDAWGRLPFIGSPDFFEALEALVVREKVTALFTPHAPTFHLLEQELGRRLPGLELMGPGPFRRQMDRVTNALADGEAGLAKARAYGEGPSPLPVEFIAGLLAQVETIHGECSRDKILAICGVVPSAPKGDIVEIGALFGKSSYVLNRVGAYGGVGATLCVDPWDLGLSVQTDAPTHIQEASGGWDWDVVYSGFLVSMLACATGAFNYLRMTSEAAHGRYVQAKTVTSREFGSTPLAGAISVLHLDGNHDESAVAQDFELWGPLVLPGGWIIFDDYNWPHGDGPRKVADRAIAAYGSRVKRCFVAGGAMFVNLAS
ncbi:class I SAM-dependent methyltransferase [Phenylobacterium sp.]|uniref:class I SAM-dependent methyltransferase n=1 Tax=Phenylobacterium sp. TaxID=1871053 RepID=UPI002FC811F1